MAVTPAIIAVALGKPAPESGSPAEAQWSMWITDASRAIERRAERLNVDPASLNAEDVDYVVRSAVVAHIVRPDDATQVTIRVDDASRSRSYSSGKGRVTIVDEWWDLLGLVDAEDVSSLRLHGEPDAPPLDPWVGA